MKEIKWKSYEDMLKDKKAEEKKKRKPKEENIKKEIAHILEYKEYLKTFTIM